MSAMHNEFPADAIGDLDRLRQRAADLQGMTCGIQDAAPERVEGTDRAGAVRVVAGPDGLPESIGVDARWKERIRPEELGAAVTEAARETARRRAEAWSMALEQQGGPRGGPGAGPGPYPGDPGAAGGAGGQPGQEAPRSLDEIAEEVLGMLDTALSSPRPGAALAQAQGASPGRTVIIALTRSGQMSCSADARWAAGQSGSQLGQALSAALATAREELRKPVAAGAGAAERAARLFTEINAAVTEAARHPGERGRA